MTVLTPNDRARLIAALDAAWRALRDVTGAESGTSRALGLLAAVHEVELLRAHPELTRLVPSERSGEAGFRLMFRAGRGGEQEVVWMAADVVAARLSPHERDLMTARET
jgi:hypothetical protein